MKINEDLQKDVQKAISWEPLLSAAEIGVTANDGVITLTGVVDSYAKKLEAESAAKNVAGVKAVVEKIEVSFGNWGKKGDAETAEDILLAFKWNWQIPAENVKVKIEEGWVTLEGEVEWNYQKEAAGKTVGSIIGVKGVTNNVSIKSGSHDGVEKKEIENALERHWGSDDMDIKVRVSGNNVTLHGTVGSFYQKDEAERIAWKAPGVWNVDNKLIIEYN